MKRAQRQTHSSRLVLATMLSFLANGLNAAGAEEALEPPAPRTGANARQTDPGYAEPVPMAPPSPQVEAPASVPAQALDIDDVSIDVRGEMPAIWRGGDHTDATLALDHSEGAPMDAAWVRRQFERQGLIGGAPASADRVTSLVQLINAAYLESGYVNSGVLIEGYRSDARTLDLKLIFGRLRAPLEAHWGAPRAGLDEEGSRGGLGADYLFDRLPAARDEPFNMIAMERQFRTLAADPALRTLNASVTPSSEAGLADLTLWADPQPRFDLYLSLANSRSPSVGGERAAIGGSVRNVIFDGSVLSSEYGVTEGLSDAVVAYATPLWAPELSFDVRAEKNEAEVVEPALRVLDITSESETLDAGVSYRLINRPLMPEANGSWKSARSLVLGARLGTKKSESFLLGIPFSFSPGSVNGVTETTVMRLTGDWIDRDNEAGLGRVWALSTTISHGLDGTRSDAPGVPSPDEDFNVLLVQANHARQLTQDGWELRARLVGQWASGLLYSSERFSVGGESTVRGYRENFLLADAGVLGSVELGKSFSLTGGRRNQAGIDWGAVRTSLFADAAWVRNEGGLAAEPQSISSVGVSLQWAPSEMVSARLTYGHALNEVANSSDDLQDEGIHFRVTVRPLAWLNDW